MERRVVEVRGTVQGVGFRPFVYRLASSLKLGGFVRNQSGRVHIEVEGEAPELDRFLETVSDRPPALAKVEELSWHPQAPQGERGFRVDDSPAGVAVEDVAIAPDVATCGACRAELGDPADRRFRYPFLNCTECGPRLTIVTGVPYDRVRTTMSGFVLCEACRREYEDPADRRFHAQPTACAHCGPALKLLDASGNPLPGNTDPLRAFAQALREGRIGALKGLGGFHLACDARQEETVSALRRRKGRIAKPFALMVRSADEAARLCRLRPEERTLLESPQAPIVLLERRPGALPRLASQVAPGCSFLGILLPYTPLHHLLMDEVGGAPLVLTSGNRADEPIAIDDHAVQQLAGIADVYLVHDRPIRVRCDDSVTRIVAGAELPIRRSRGAAPQPLRLPVASFLPTLAVGGQLKATFGLSNGRQAILSHHLGDLDHPAAFDAFVRDVDLFQDLFAIRPARIVHDLHPDYASTDYARSRAEREGLELVAVQHHHAHMAACMAENRLSGPAIGVTFDGSGYGADGTLWGGEFLIGDYRSVRRAAHLEEFPMPGGEQAIREPWRMALAYLVDSGGDLGALEPRIAPAALHVVRQMVLQGVHCPRTSSMGRLFDGIASILGIRDRVSYEGQAACELETIARGSAAEKPYPVDFHLRDSRWVLRLAPVVAGVERDLYRRLPIPVIARRFHATVVEMIRETLIRLREESGIADVVLSGGVFSNSLILEESLRRLGEEGFRVHRHRRVPPNDGGLCLGQLAVAAAGGGERACA